MKYYLSYNELIDPECLELKQKGIELLGSGCLPDKVITFMEVQDKLVMNIENADSYTTPFLIYQIEDNLENYIDKVENIEIKNKQTLEVIFFDYETNIFRKENVIAYFPKEKGKYKIPPLELTQKLLNAYCTYNIPLAFLQDSIRYCKSKINYNYLL